LSLLRDGIDESDSLEAEVVANNEASLFGNPMIEISGSVLCTVAGKTSGGENAQSPNDGISSSLSSYARKDAD
jgi:hypothetical protein